MRRTSRGLTVDELLEDWDEYSLPEGRRVDLDPLSSRLPLEPMVEAVDLAAQLKKVYADNVDPDAEFISRWTPTAWEGHLKTAKAIEAAFFIDGVWNDYNDFKADHVAEVVGRFPKLKFRFGREYSPVLYAKGDESELEKFKEAIKKTRPNELDLQKDNSIRAWWD